MPNQLVMILLMPCGLTVLLFCADSPVYVAQKFCKEEKIAMDGPKLARLMRFIVQKSLFYPRDSKESNQKVTEDKEPQKPFPSQPPACVHIPKRVCISLC